MCLWATSRPPTPEESRNMADKNQKPALFSHERIETSNPLLITLTLIVLSIGILVEVVPLYFQRSTTEPAADLKPYTAFELVSRDTYIREHSYCCQSSANRSHCR